MCIGRLERLVTPDRRASRSMELMSPTSSRRLASSSSRKFSSSLGDRPAWFLRGLPLVGTGARGTGALLGKRWWLSPLPARSRVGGLDFSRRLDLAEAPLAGRAAVLTAVLLPDL